MKIWSIGLIGFIIFSTIAIKPTLITKYGYTNKLINNAVRWASILLFIIWVIPHKELSIDTLGYIKYKKNYIEERPCIIKKTYNSVWFFFAQKSILCENNNVFIDIFTGRHYYKGEKVEVKYLPASKLIVDI